MIDEAKVYQLTPYHSLSSRQQYDKQTSKLQEADSPRFHLSSFCLFFMLAVRREWWERRRSGWKGNPRLGGWGGEGGFSGRFKCLCYLRGVLKSVSRWLDAGFSDWPSGIPQWSLRDSFIWFCFALALVGIRRTAGRGPSAPDDATAGSIQSTSASSDFLQLGLTSGTWLGFRFLLCYRPGLIPRGRRGEGLDDGGRGGER